MLRKETKGSVTRGGSERPVRWVRYRSPDLVHRGGCQGHCVRDDNASDIHLVHQPGIEPGAQ